MTGESDLVDPLRAASRRRFGPVRRARPSWTCGVPRAVSSGFLGPNGAGKSTAIRILLDLARADSGRVRGPRRRPAHASPAVRRRIGYLPGELRLDPRLSVARDPGRPGAGCAAAASTLRWTDELCERLSLDPSRATRGAVDRQPAQGGAGRRVHGPPRAAGPGRADQRPRPAGPGRVRRAGARGLRDDGAHGVPVLARARRGAARWPTTWSSLRAGSRGRRRCGRGAASAGPPAVPRDVRRRASGRARAGCARASPTSACTTHVITGVVTGSPGRAARGARRRSGVAHLHDERARPRGRVPAVLPGRRVRTPGVDLRRTRPRPAARSSAEASPALRRSAVWWTVGLVAFIAVNLAFWPSLSGSDALTSLEESTGSLLEAFGAAGHRDAGRLPRRSGVRASCCR